MLTLPCLLCCSDLVLEEQLVFGALANPGRANKAAPRPASLPLGSLASATLLRELLTCYRVPEAAAAAGSTSVGGSGKGPAGVSNGGRLRLVLVNGHPPPAIPGPALIAILGDCSERACFEGALLESCRAADLVPEQEAAMALLLERRLVAAWNQVGAHGRNKTLMVGSVI